MAQQLNVYRELHMARDGMGGADALAVTTMDARNKSGGSVSEGDIVIFDRSSNTTGDIISFTTTTTANNADVLGMVFEGTIADGGVGKIQIWGPTTKLKVDGNTDISIGDPIGTFTSAKIGQKGTWGGGVVALANEAYTTNDSSGVIDAFIVTGALVGRALGGTPSTPAAVSTATGTAAVGMSFTGQAGGGTTIATTGTGGAGASFTFTGGAGGQATLAATAGTGGAGGSHTLTGGAGGASAVTGSGNGTGGAGGGFTVTGGAGGAVTTSTGTNTGGAGGGLSLTGGAGGAASNGTDTGGIGGSVTIAGGAGGNGDTSGVPGDVNITGGAAGTGGNVRGGNIVLTVGAAVGSGALGAIKIGSSTSFVAQNSGAATMPTLPTGFSEGTPKWLRIQDNSGTVCIIPVIVSA